MSAGDPFARLAPFIQAYIYQHRWVDLRAIQKAAIPAIMESDEHVLIMSGTASGKTEAAMLPVLTMLEQSPVESVGVLYIGPLKALINDQFERINLLLQEMPDIPIQGWHGDIAQSQKTRFLKRPRGILQITPESLEALLVNRSGELRALFGDLRFIIIDEIHAFLGTDRGQQVLCQLQRLERALGRSIRRIGLSATIGDTEVALQWLASSAQFSRAARLVTESDRGRHIELRVNHFVLAREEKTFHAPMAPDELHLRRSGQTTSGVGSSAEEESGSAYPFDERWGLQQSREHYYDDLFAMTIRNQKTLIFTNRRNQAEGIAAELRQRLAQVQPGSDWYFVHHSSIAADWRALAEARMREQAQQACIVATASLELGIDVGHLDLTVQVDAPHTVSSFVQRLGRSGRRGTPSRMCFYSLEYLGKEAPALEQVPWKFLQTIAIIQLYLEERWIEPSTIPTLPLSLLYQQTMSILQACTEMTPAQLARAVLTLAPFQSITQEEYRLFLQNLLTRDHLAKMDEGTLIVGIKGAQVTGFYHFYAIFADEQEYRVLAGTQEVGAIHQVPEIGGILGLAGYAWRVISLDVHRKIVHVERAKGVVQASWQSSGAVQFHARIMQRLRQVLQEETVYSYLSQLARQRLALARDLVRQGDWLRSSVVRLEPGRFALFPWEGSRVYQTLLHVLRAADWYTHPSMSGSFIEVVYDGDEGAVIAELRKLSPRVPELINGLVAALKDGQLWQGKYDALAPRTLLEKAYINDVLDIPGAMHWLDACS